MDPLHASSRERRPGLGGLASLLLVSAPLAQQGRVPARPPLSLLDQRPADFSLAPCGNSVELRWRDVSTAELGFVVLRRPAGVGPFQELALTAPGATSFTDTPPSGTFDYRVATRTLVHGVPRDTPPTRTRTASFPNLPPVITTDLSDPRLHDGRSPVVARFTVTVTDPEGDPVSLQLLNPAPGMLFAPLEQAASPATVEVRWSPTSFDEARMRLVFEASCGVRREQDVELTRARPDSFSEDAGLLVGDVTGDGRLDALAVAELAGAADTGEILVFAGSATPLGVPSAILTVAGDSLRPRNSFASHVVQLADVTGDGVLDVVAHALSQRVHVWAGGVAMSGALAPTATLTPPGTSATPAPFGDTLAPLLQFADLDQDEVLDVVTFDRLADTPTLDAGAAFVWLGGAGLAGVVAPFRTLSVPGGVTGDWLGHGQNSNDEGGLFLADLTEDGVLDFLVNAPLADVAGNVDAGAIFLWSGAAVLAGTTTPTATLRTSACSDCTGDPLLGDVTGDGHLDVVAGSPKQYPGDMAGHEGFFQLWPGGAWSGTKFSTCSYRNFQATHLGSAYTGLLEVTGDGVLDFVAVTPAATVAGVGEAGAIYVWAGGAASGTPPPSATLHVPGATANRQLGGNGYRFQDLDGDDVLDLVATDLAPAIYVWKGGSLSGPSGMVAPDATLGLAGSSQFALLALDDLDGDGNVDLVAGNGGGRMPVWSGASDFEGALAPAFEFSGGSLFELELCDLDGDQDLDALASGPGGTHLWRGGPGLFAATEPDATLVSSFGLSQARRFVDWDRDGVLDVCGTRYTATVGGVTQAGVLQIWSVGAGTSGSVPATLTLSVPGARAFDRLGLDGVRWADLDGDGRLDCLAISPESDASASIVNSGAIPFWSGALLQAESAPQAVFADPAGLSHDRLGDAVP